MKNLTTGDGGMITTNDAALAEKLARYRSVGQDLNVFARYGRVPIETGTPGRMTSLGLVSGCT